MNDSIRHNIVFLIVAHLCFLSHPAIVHAQTASYNPVNFTQPLSVARGELRPIGPDGFYLNKEETCEFVVAEYGWRSESCESVDYLIAVPTPEIDSILVAKPVSDGYVQLDDWNNVDADEEISRITAEYRTAVKAQSERLGVPIEFNGWRAYPTVNTARNSMHYAGMLLWDQSLEMNIKIVLFDRRGYLELTVVPMDSAIDENEIDRLVAKVAEMYVPAPSDSYAAFSTGDKVASYGALGVFAGLLGVKYGKAAATGLLALAMIFLKKAWFLLFLPLVWVGKLFKRG